MLSDVAGTPRSAYAKGCWKMFAALSPSRTSTMKDSPVLRSLTATWTRLSPWSQSRRTSIPSL